MPAACSQGALMCQYACCPACRVLNDDFSRVTQIYRVTQYNIACCYATLGQVGGRESDLTAGQVGGEVGQPVGGATGSLAACWPGGRCFAGCGLGGRCNRGPLAGWALLCWLRGQGARADCGLLQQANSLCFYVKSSHVTPSAWSDGLQVEPGLEALEAALEAGFEDFEKVRIT